MDDFNQEEAEQIVYFLDRFGELDDWCLSKEQTDPAQIHRALLIRAKVREILGLDPNEPIESGHRQEPSSWSTQSKPPAYQEPEEPDDANFEAQLAEAFRLSLAIAGGGGGQEEPSSSGVQGMTPEAISQFPATIADEPYGSSSECRIRTKPVTQSEIYSIQLARKRKDKPDKPKALPGQPDFWWGQLQKELPAAADNPIQIGQQLSAALEAMLTIVERMHQSMNQVVPGMSVQGINKLTDGFISVIARVADEAMEQLFEPMRDGFMKEPEFESRKHYFGQVLPQLETSLENLQSGFRAGPEQDRQKAFDRLRQAIDETESRILMAMQLVIDVVREGG